jgi:hypothetical protein
MQMEVILRYTLYHVVLQVMPEPELHPFVPIAGYYINEATGLCDRSTYIADITGAVGRAVIPNYGSDGSMQPHQEMMGNASGSPTSVALLLYKYSCTHYAPGGIYL